MSSGTPVSDKHLQNEKHQCYAEEIHELLVVFLKHHGIIFLILHLADVAYDRGQAELIVAGMDVGSASGSFEAA